MTKKKVTSIPWTAVVVLCVSIVAFAAVSVLAPEGAKEWVMGLIAIINAAVSLFSMPPVVAGKTLSIPPPAGES